LTGVIVPRVAPEDHTRRYLEHLGEADLRLLGRIAGADPPRLRRDPGRVVALLDRPRSPTRCCPADRGAGTDVGVWSPFLVFAVAVHRAAAEVARTGHLPEWTGPRQRVPRLLGPGAPSLLAEPRFRLFLAELLASYARVRSGAYLRRTARGWRRTRYSELDPVRLAGLLDAVPAAERAGVYRRLGDLALFLSGAFPDHLWLHGFGSVDAVRLLRTVGLPAERADAGAVALLELLGGRWYRAASGGVAVPTGRAGVVGEVAARFGEARRALTLVVDRYLWPPGGWTDLVRRSR
jgi:hypothetical protein